jgi:hypothetical protein
MMHTVLPPLRDDRRAAARRRATFLALGVCLAALIAALATVLASLAGATLSAAVAFVPSRADGQVPDGEPLDLTDTDEPALANLDGPLLDALRLAQADVDGISIRITSGWRSAQFQQWLLDDAVDTYGSEEVARQYVALPADSRHVTGDAVDVGPLDAQLWLIEHGSAYGICQIYANERWHFELATDAGGVCPALRENAAG